MKITINGTNADIQLESEKTVGEVLSALETWFAGSRHRLSGLCINGETINAESMEACFGRDLAGIETIDIVTSSLPELYAESLLRIIGGIDVYEAADFEGKKQFAAQWEESPEAQMLAEQSSDLHNWVINTFAGSGSSPQLLRALVEERLRELQDPAAEMGKAKSLVNDICSRLEELPLDIQTGKDSKAVETVSLFSGITEKVFRLYNVLRIEDYPVIDIQVDNKPVAGYIAEFGTELRELLTAYEKHDSVLVGDLAEYEMAPRLRGLFDAIFNAMKQGE